MAIERRSLDIKTDHNKKLRAIMTNEQRPAFNIDLISYFEEVLDFNMGIWDNMKKNVVNDHEIDFKNNKSSTGLLTAIRLGYLF